MGERDMIVFKCQSCQQQMSRINRQKLTWFIGLLLLLSLASGGKAVAEDPKVQLLEAENRALRSQVIQLKAEIKRLTEVVSRLTAARQDPPPSQTMASPPPTTAPAPVTIIEKPHPEWEASFRLADRHNGQLPELRTVAVGNAGRLPGGWVTVVQVLGKSEMIARYRTREAPAESWEKAIFSGVDTSDMVDERGFGLGGPFLVSGTRRIRTADGASYTYFIVKPLDEKAWRAAYLAWKKAGGAAHPTSTPAAPRDAAQDIRPHVGSTR